ncbi:glycerophosphodiester phosphodiesterase family protein [Roseimicrobium sp. ORNL1]|uniref:glycerophosphodiester phosphodiesterase n=1 Tax=Roseimicrobium sp. ORNL1 TaxID=2711231 RepID=UPI0013E20150|nr:glycerophosphodiester phosphodiesterase family protein [Roseimicrobium sp. ORNL1]QIF03395.1 glycerophosphodiester phosphodiesterase [Roseimicrobium sp. ORNL1]
MLRLAFLSLLTLAASHLTARASEPVPTTGLYQGVRVIAHRGAGFEFDENTVEGCKHSYDKGIRGFEVDIRLTKDNHLVLMHDADTARTTNGKGKIEDLTLAEIQALRTTRSGVPVPSVTDLFTYFKDKPEVLLLLELKTKEEKVYTEDRLAIYCRLVDEATRKLLPAGTYHFTSFDKRSLTTMKRLQPDVLTGLLTSTFPTPELIAEAKAIGSGRLSVSLDATSRKMAREVKDAGLQVSLWPIKSKADADLAVMMGANILCTDVPSEVLGVQGNAKDVVP